MIKAEDFYKTFGKYEDVLQCYGFNLKRHNVYEQDGKLQLSLVLDDWGWNKESGWGFLIRVIDTRYLMSDGGVSDWFNGVLSVDFSTILREKLVDDSVLQKAYAPHPQLFDRGKESGMWIPFYAIADLSGVLDQCLIPIMEYVADWSKKQLSKPVVRNVTSKPTISDRKKVIDDLKSLGLDAK